MDATDDTNITLQIPTSETMTDFRTMKKSPSASPSSATNIQNVREDWDDATTGGNQPHAQSTNSDAFDASETTNQHSLIPTPPNFLTSPSSTHQDILAGIPSPKHKQDRRSISGEVSPPSSHYSTTQSAAAAESSQAQADTKEQNTSSHSPITVPTSLLSSSPSLASSSSSSTSSPSPLASVPRQQPSARGQHLPTETAKFRKGGAEVKVEPPDDMKDYVETTMNELLGWYGLPSVDNTDTGRLQAMTSLAYRKPQKNAAATSSRPSSLTTTTTTNAESVIDNVHTNGEKDDNDDDNSTQERSLSSEKFTQSNNNDETARIATSSNLDGKNTHYDNLHTMELPSKSLALKTSNDSNNDDNNNNNNNNDDDDNSISDVGNEKTLDKRSTTPNEHNTVISASPRRPPSASVENDTSCCSRDSNGICDESMVIGPISVQVDDDDDECSKNYTAGNYDENEDEDNDDQGDFGDDESFKEGLLARQHRDSVSAASDSSNSSNAVAVPENERSVVIKCSWCQKRGNKLLTLETPSGVKVFCSELCFTQCRRASFKKNKVCDWCKHVRHTVNFVDFQDGDTQLQFCSEKCLNQYKMNIFCKEAQEHLQHFHDLDEGLTNSTTNNEEKSDRSIQKEILITPELWLAGNDPEKKGQGRLIENVKQEVDECSIEDDENPRYGRMRENTSRRGNTDGELPPPGSNGGDDDDDADNDIDESDDVKDDLCDEDDYNDSEPGEIGSMTRLHRDNRLENQLAVAVTDDELNSARVEKTLRKNAFHSEYLKMKRGKSIETKEKERDSSGRHQRDIFPPTRLLSDNRKHNVRGQNSGVSTGHVKSADESNNESLSPKTTDILLQQWAASRLLTLMPQHMRGEMAGLAGSDVAGLGQPQSPFPYSANSMLYSNLFRLPRPQASSSTSTMSANNLLNGESSGVGRSDSHILKSRHESRRELLRDRDLFHTTEKKTKSFHERERPETSSVPLSPSTSHSSAGTPGPTHFTDPNALSSQFPGFGRPFPHSLLMPNSAHPSVSPALFSDPAHASALFQLHLALQQNAERNNILSSETAHHPPPQPPHSSSKDKHSNRSQRFGETSGSFQQNAHASPSPSTQHQHRPPQNPQSTTHQPSTPTLFPFSQGVPPVTVLVPHPVAIPIPLPIPFPIPISPEKFHAFLARNSESNSTATFGSQTQREGNDSNNPNTTTSSLGSERNTPKLAHPLIKHSPASSPSPFNAFSPNLDLPGSSASPPVVTEGTEDFLSLRHETIHPYIKSPSSSTSMKRSLSETITPYTFDLSKKPRHSVSSSSNDEEAMDLSKQSSSSTTPKSTSDVSEKENTSLTSRFTLAAVSTPSPENLVVPKIHIVSDKTAPPLNTPPMTSPLPLPLEQSSYSSRRSRILDAPSVPKTSRMPSPERRYVRNVPKDMVEAAKRRGLRARIKTK